MEVPPGVEEGFVREWTPCSHILNLIPLRVQNGIFSSELCLTCVDAVTEYIALGTNVGLVYWYDRKKGNIQKLKCEASSSPITFVKIVSTVDYMVGAGNAAGQVTVFQIPKEHPENIPDNFKPKVEPKVERYTIGDLHKSEITSIEWSKNGMRLFSGDKNGVIIMTEIDFYMHLCKSVEIVNEGHPIVQLSYYGNALLVSSLYRSILCERRAQWRVTQLGTRERRSLSPLGAVWQYSYGAGAGGGVGGGGGAEPRVYCARPGLRVWRADKQGTVLQTLLFKEAISNPLTVVELLNPGRNNETDDGEPSLGALHVFREQFLVSCDVPRAALYVLDPRSLQAAAVTHHLRRILSVSVHKDEMFVLEGPRSLVRLAHRPEPAAHVAEDPLGLMTKSLTTSLQNAVNTVRDLAQLDHTVPIISHVLDPATPSYVVVSGEECFELPPVARLPNDIAGNVLESIVNEFQDISSDAEEIRRVKSEELQRKLKLYNSIMEKKCDEELIHSSRRSRNRGGSGCSTPRHATPVRKVDGLYTTPCVMNISVYSDVSQENDELLEKQIEEKEKILAKMLNLESLSIIPPITEPERTDSPVFQPITARYPENKPIERFEKELPPKIKQIVPKDPKPVDLVPKVMKLPNNWNLENIKLDLKPKFGKNGVLSPDEHLDSEWEII